MNIIFADTKTKLREAAALFKDSVYVACDTETNGLDCLQSTFKLWCVQFSDGVNHVFIPYNITQTLGDFKALMEDDTKVFVFHNAKYDIRVFNRFGYSVANAVCTQVTEFLLTAGLWMPCDLKSTYKRRLGVEISKEERKDFYDGTFEAEDYISHRDVWTDARINYAMGDVFNLVDLCKLQLREIRRLKLRPTFDLEMDLLPVLCKLENIGVRMDKRACMEFQIRMQKRVDEVYEELNRSLGAGWEKAWRRQYAKDTAIYDKWGTEHSLIISRTNKMRDESNRKKLSAEAIAERQRHEAKKPFPARPKEKGVLNLNSHVHIKAAFAELGLVLPSTKKELLEVLKDEHPLLGLLLEYKKYVKLAQFGELYEHINPATGKIHADFNQVVSTGRLSCRRPNLQNITARSDEGKEFRSLFRARNGYKFIGADFAGIELVIIGVLSGNKKLLKAVNNDYDIHCFSMESFLDCPYDILVRAKEKKELFPSEVDAIKKARLEFEKGFSLPDLQIVPVSDVSKWVKDLRNNYLKHVSYGLAYGLSPFGLARKFRSSREVGEAFQRGFFDRCYPGLESFFEDLKEVGYRKGFSETVLGRKRFYRKAKKKTIEEVKKGIVSDLKKSKRNLDSITPDEWDDLLEAGMKKADREYFMQVSAIKREAGNMPIQGTSADITKLAMVICDEMLVEAGFPEDEGLILTVHDELWIEAKACRAKKAVEILKVAMEQAAHEFLGDDVLIKVTPHTTDHWEK